VYSRSVRFAENCGVKRAMLSRIRATQAVGCPARCAYKTRDHLAFKQAVERLGFGRVPGRVVAMFLAVSQGPAHFRPPGFRPPTVQLRKIDAPVHEYLHAARSTSLPGPLWRVDPDIYSLHKKLGQEHVVVTEEEHMGPRLGPSYEMGPFSNQGLPGLVRRMGFARKDELHRAIAIGQQAEQSLGS